MKNLYIFQFNRNSERNLLPLAAGLLTAYVRADPVLQSNYKPIIEVRRRNPHETVADINNPTVLAFSAYAWNIRQSLAVARLAKKQFPHATIVFGGPSVPLGVAESASFLRSNRFVDILVHGEGEVTFGELLITLLNESSLEGVLGISYQYKESNAGIFRTADRKRILDLDTLPSPFLDGTFDEFLGSYRSLISGALWETSRGCPYSCSFCQWGDPNEKSLTVYGEKRLFCELDWIADHEIKYVLAADSNFGILKNRDLSLAEYISELSIRTGYPKYFRVNWVKRSYDQVVKISDTLIRGGLGAIQVTLSMQSLNYPTLKAVRRVNIPTEEYNRLKKMLSDRHVDTYTEMMLPLPCETYDSFAEGLMKTLSPYPGDRFSLFNTSILTSTEMRSPDYQKKFNIESRNCVAGFARQRMFGATIDEFEELIVGTRTMPISEWRRAYRFGHLCRSLHSMRIAFFIMEFLREHCGLSLRRFVEYITNEGNFVTYPTIASLLGIFDLYTDAILHKGRSVLPIDEYHNRLWEPHEMFFLSVMRSPERFYKELQSLVLGFTSEIEIERQLIEDACYFQECISPCTTIHTKRCEFHYDLVPYYKKLIKGENIIPLREAAVTVEFETPLYHYTGDLDYAVACILSGTTPSNLLGSARTVVS